MGYWKKGEKRHGTDEFKRLRIQQSEKKTKRDEFLEIMDGIIPWDEWGGVIQPFCCKGQYGRPPKGVELILRMYLLQYWFHLTDEGVEDAIYDSYAFRKFMGINFMEQDVPDATTLLRFRHLLEENGLNKLFFDAINRVMVAGVHRLADQPPSQEFAEGVRQGDRLGAVYRASKVLCAL